MRCAVAVGLAVLSLAAGSASARPGAATAGHDDGDFWRDMLEPHASQVASLIQRAERAMTHAAPLTTDGDGAIDQRMRVLDDAYGMLRYARTLSPDSCDVLRPLGSVALMLGKIDDARDALETCVRAVGPERAGARVTSRLGAIALRMGKVDDGVRWLEYAQGPLSAEDHAVPTVMLAAAYAGRGQMADALDLLNNALPDKLTYYNDALSLVSLALAVYYDRDDQPGAAFAVLDRMQGSLQPDFGSACQRALALTGFAPAEDQYYYRAMVFEATGAYIEARAAWALYAAVPDAQWRRRALDHIHAIDAQRRAHPGHIPPTNTPTPSSAPVP